MFTKKFKIGDRVRALDSSPWYEDLSVDTGTIVCKNLYVGSYGIKFDEPVRYGKGHCLKNTLNEEEAKYGYYIDEKDLISLKGGNYNEY